MKNTFRNLRRFAFLLSMVLALTWPIQAQETHPTEQAQATTVYSQKILPILRNSCFDCHGPGAMAQVKAKDPARRKKIEGILKKAHYQYPMEENFPSGGDEDPKYSLQHFIRSISKGVMPPAKGRKLYGLGKPLSSADKKILLDWAKSELALFKDKPTTGTAKEEGKQEPQTDAENEISDLKESVFRVQVHLFGDMDYEFLGTAGNFPAQNDFFLGRTAIAFVGRYGDQIEFLDQNVVEFHGLDPALEVDRLLATYIFGPELRVSAGRDHTAFGYWNRNFGYVGFQQTTIESPFFLRFEDDGGVVPVHISGFTAEGQFAIGDSSFGYELNGGNAPDILVTGDNGGNVEEAEFDTHAGGGTNRKVFAGRLTFRPSADGILELGVAGAFNRYASVITPDLAGTAVDFQDLGQVLLEGEIVLKDEHLELLGEFYNFNDQAAGLATQGSPNNTAFYGQAAYELLEDFRPYFRVENLTVDASDPLFLALNQKSKTVYLAGIRLEVVPTISCLKLEYQYLHQDAGDSMELNSQWAFGF